MKKLMIIALVAILIAAAKVYASGNERVLYFDDVNTKNFVAKVGYLRLYDMKMFCSDDYCGYVNGSTIYECLDNFTRDYLDTIEDEEAVSSLNIKGIKITKIILQN